MKRLLAFSLVFVILLFNFTRVLVTSAAVSDIPDSIYNKKFSVNGLNNNSNFLQYASITEYPVYYILYAVSSNLNYPFDNLSYYLALIVDKTSSTFDIDNGNHLVFDTDVDPGYTYLYANSKQYTSSIVLNSNYDIYYTYYSGGVWKDSINKIGDSINGFVFDNYNSDLFPIYNTKYFSKYILASNVDLVSRAGGRVLQYGNYYTFFDYFDNNILFDVVDYSGHESSSGQTVTTSSNSSVHTTTTTVNSSGSSSNSSGSSGGSSGSNGSSSDSNSAEQLETTKSIFSTVKEIFSTLYYLPEKIQEAFNDFINNIISTVLSVPDLISDALKYLFVPSDNLFIDLVDLIKSKFNFIFQFIELGNFLLTYDYSEYHPDISIDFVDSVELPWGTFSVDFLDWSVIEPYRDHIKNFTFGISFFFFTLKIRKRLPSIISGISSGGNFDDN